ncbi:S10 family peptidase [Rhizobium sp. LjRoot254]|uniref:S10 family peptidase n=1 Tax=Rhizobium sp. LjRoot254 TaxID=3342297 RepID=UPI003ECDFC9D
MKLRTLLPLVVTAAALILTPAYAENVRDGASAYAGTVRDNTPAEGILELLPADAETSHVLKTANREIGYTATAGTLDLFGQDGKISAKIFYTAYVAKDSTGKRPLTFAFNGGPGAASAYLHLGLVGPRVLDFGPGNDDGATPELKDNPDSWLDFTDLVLIDPVGTGWSRAANNSDSFYSVKQDAETIAKVIALYTQHNNRTSAPKYLLGESYGGFRAAKVGMALKNTQGMLISGIIMVSPLIEARLIFGATDYPLGAALQLPSIAAAELERTNTFSPEAVAKAEHYAMTDYIVSLAGATPFGPKGDAFYSKLAEMTGIDRDKIVRTGGFVGDVFSKTDGGRIASPYDAAYTAPDAYPETPLDRSDDPVLDGFTRAYGSVFAGYARNELNYACDMTYNLLSLDVNRRWNWGEGRDSSRADAGASKDIRDLLSAIPSFRLMVMHGYSDVLTPYGASRYVLDHLPPTLAKGRTELTKYRGGHMFYTRADSRTGASRDARRFYASGAGTE